MVQGSSAKRWVFTLNNYTDDDCDFIEGLCYDDEYFEYLVYGKEVGESGTPHLQGFFVLNTKQRLTWLKTNISDTAHFEIARGTNQEASDYCKKVNQGDDVVPNEEVFEYGELPAEAGARTDLALFRESVNSGIRDPLTLMTLHDTVWARHYAYCQEYLTRTRVVPPPANHPLRAWQVRLNNILIGTPDSRKIIFCVDPRGNSGKTWYTRHHKLVYGNSHMMRMASEADMAAMMDYEAKTVFFDIPRAKQEHFYYPVLEMIKDGALANRKYQSRMEHFSPPHVVVMCNFEPDYTKLSPDRYVIIRCD